MSLNMFMICRIMQCQDCLHIQFGESIFQNDGPDAKLLALSSHSKGFWTHLARQGRLYLRMLVLVPTSGGGRRRVNSGLVSRYGYRLEG